MLYEMRKDAIENIIDVLADGYSGYYCDLHNEVFNTDYYVDNNTKAKEMLGMRLCVLHNLYFYNTMMTEIREAIDNHCYAEYKAKKLAGVEGNYKDRFTE